MARKTLAAERAASQIAEITMTDKNLEIAVGGLERIAGIVHAAMQGPGLPIGSSLLCGSRPVTVREAVEHAIEVTRPLAEEHRAAITCEVSPALMDVPAGSLYTVLLNGLRNAVESIHRAGGIGTVRLVVNTSADPRSHDRSGASWLSITITDDGGGVNAHRMASRNGIGLAVADHIVCEMGGMLDLCTRTDRADTKRPGAIFRVLAPIPSSGDANIGREE